MMQLFFCFLFLLFYVIIIVSCEFLNKKGLQVEYTRKLAHSFSALSSLLLPIAFSSHWYVLVLVVSSFILLYVGNRRQLFRSINSVSRKTYGAYLLPISIGIAYYVSLSLQNEILFTLPILILAISDSLACIFGKTYKSKILKYHKTAIGTFAFFLSTFVICCFVLSFQLPVTKTIGIALGISIITSVMELISPNGIDNLSIPISVIASLLLLEIVLT